MDLLEYDDAGGAIVPTSPGAGSSGIGLSSSLEKDGHLERPETYEEDLMLLDIAIAASMLEVSYPHLYLVGHVALPCIAPTTTTTTTPTTTTTTTTTCYYYSYYHYYYYYY